MTDCVTKLGWIILSNIQKQNKGEEGWEKSKSKNLHPKKAMIDECKISIDELNNIGENIAENLLKNGGSNLMREIKSQMK